MSGHCRSLALKRNDGSVRCGGPQAFSDRGPHRWEQTRWWGSEPSAVSVASGAAPATRPGRFWQMSGSGWQVLVPIGLGLNDPDEVAARFLGGWLSRWWRNWRATHGSTARTREHLGYLRWRLRCYRPQGIRGAAGSAQALLSSTVVGATGFEPVTSSVSANHRQPLCEAAFSQVTINRRCGS